MGFSVSLAYGFWDYVVLIASAIGALGTIAVFITYFHLKERFKHDLEKEDEKRQIDYRLLVLEHLGPLHTCFLRGYYVEKYHHDVALENALARTSSVNSGESEQKEKEEKYGIDVRRRLRLFTQKLDDYPLFLADFPVSYKLLNNLFDSLYEVSCKRSNSTEKYITYRELFCNSLKLTTELVRFIITRSPDDLRVHHQKEKTAKEPNLFATKQLDDQLITMNIDEIEKYRNFFNDEVGEVFEGMKKTIVKLADFGVIDITLSADGTGT